MKFFTDGTIEWPYLLTSIDKYLKMSNERKIKFKEILIDPGVYFLKKNPTLKWEGKINIAPFLDSLPKNHFLSCDFPSDMNLNYKKLLLEKSWSYAQGYCYHPQFIVTIQFIHNSFWFGKNSLMKMFDKYNQLKIRSGFIGIGNLCKQKYNNDFMKHALPYILKNSNYKKIHIYGLSIKNIPIADKLAKRYGIELSIDSTKWTMPIQKEIRSENTLWFTHEKRQIYFDTYLKVIKERGVEIE